MASTGEPFPRRVIDRAVDLAKHGGGHVLVLTTARVWGEAVRPESEERLLNLPDVPEHWLVGKWYSVACLEGQWGRADPRQSDLKEISREQFEQARTRGWREPP